MKLESLVPPLEDCQKIPIEWFPDSVLVWHFSQTKNMGIFEREPWNEKESYPAPTLAEIMAAFSDISPAMGSGNNISIRAVEDGTYEVGRLWRSQVERDNNPAAAALRLLFKIKEV